MPTALASRKDQRVAELTTGKKLLVAAWRLQKAGNYFATFEDLVVAAWKSFPQTFGLRGQESEYPCSNRVSAALFDSRSPLKTGAMDRQRLTGRYFVTAAGVIEARRLAKELER